MNNALTMSVCKNRAKLIGTIFLEGGTIILDSDEKLQEF